MTHNGSVITNLPEKFFSFFHLREKSKLSGRAYRQLTTENECRAENFRQKSCRVFTRQLFSARYPFKFGPGA